MSILSKIQALITAANNTTGESDTTLTDAVQTLVDGYGQGGTTLPLFIKHEAITITSDRLSVETGGNPKAFSDEFMRSLKQSQIGYPTILVLVENTSNSQYAAQSAIRLSGVTNNVTTTTRIGLRSNSFGIDMTSPTASFYTGAGSVVHRYVFVREEPTS